MYSIPILLSFFSLTLLGLGQISSNEGTMKVPLSRKYYGHFEVFFDVITDLSTWSVSLS